MVIGNSKEEDNMYAPFYSFFFRKKPDARMQFCAKKVKSLPGFESGLLEQNANANTVAQTFYPLDFKNADQSFFASRCAKTS